MNWYCLRRNSVINLGQTFHSSCFTRHAPCSLVNLSLQPDFECFHMHLKYNTIQHFGHIFQMKHQVLSMTSATVPLTVAAVILYSPNFLIQAQTYTCMNSFWSSFSSKERFTCPLVHSRPKVVDIGFIELVSMFCTLSFKKKMTTPLWNYLHTCVAYPSQSPGRKEF